MPLPPQILDRLATIANDWRSAARSVRATPVERTRTLPGDELIPEALTSLTHAVLIRRPPRDVWPWLAQMGAGSRAGWYSYDFLDNGCQPSSERVVSDLQRLTVGMVFPALPHVTESFTLLAFDPGRFLIIGWKPLPGIPLMTWAFVLQEVEGGWTRLVVRARGARGYHFNRLPWWLGRRIIPIVHFIMQRKQLLGIAKRAEHARDNDSNTAGQRAA